MNEYYIEDLFGYHDYDYLNEVIDRALKKLELKDVSFSVILIDDEKMKELNKKHRGIDQTTDVLSFALNDNYQLDLPVNLLGDIYISIPQMKKQAKEYKTGEERELCFLTIHGLLHLLGYDHENKDDEEIMFKLQKELLP